MFFPIYNYIVIFGTFVYNRREELFIFTHIPRTGGTSFRFNLKSQNINKEILVEAHRKIFLNKKYTKPNLFFLQGHIPYGIHSCFSDDRDYKYITFVREPLERWKSFFNLDIKRKNKYLRKILWEKNSKGNILRFLEMCIYKDIHSNIMVKQLSGCEQYDNIDDSRGAWSYTWASRKEKYTHSQMMEMVDKAEYNIFNVYSFVGNINKYQESINSMCDLVGVRTFNINDLYKRPSFENVFVNLKSDKSMSLIKEINKYDIILYNRIKDKI
jgi:hypothetical protein